MYTVDDRRLQAAIEEIQSLIPNSDRRSASRIAEILENLRPILVQKMGSEDLEIVIVKFKALGETSAREYLSNEFHEQFSRQAALLNFYFNRLL